MKNEIKNNPSLFHTSINCNIFDYLGSHLNNNTLYFRVWAPHADEVWLVGDFNGWSQSHPMKRITDGGVWECSADKHSLMQRPLYKYKIRTGNRTLYKSDPFGRQMQNPPDTATVWRDSDASYGWSDNLWINGSRKAFSSNFSSRPMNVYEMHLGSFMRHFDGSYMTYKELAPILASYLKKMSYTHVELMPLSEHQKDSSLGYDITGFYSITSRFGSPDEFKYLINTLHNSGIGVILDLPLSHFPCDEHGLFEFDGHQLYEPPLTSEYGTKRSFDVTKTEVQSFLISYVCFYAREFHVDGVRLPDIDTMLYRNLSQSVAEHASANHEDDLSDSVLEFIVQLVNNVKRLYPDMLMICGERASHTKTKNGKHRYPNFDLEWDAFGSGATSLLSNFTDPQAIADVTEALKKNVPARILPLSQSSLSLSRRSLLDRTEGEYENRFAQLRAFLAYYFTLPGKKLSFMSNEYGQFAPWKHTESIEWFMLRYDMHRKLRDFNADMGALYLNTPALWELDDSPDGCVLLTRPEDEQRYVAYKRISANKNELYVLLSFNENTARISGCNIPDGNYRILISTAYEKYGGPRPNDTTVTNVSDGVLDINIAPFESLILETTE